MAISRASARPGFSLAELMVAIVILAVGVLGMGGLMGANSRMQRISTAHIDMVQLAESKLDELRALHEDTPLTNGGSLTTQTSAYYQDYTVATSRKYTVRWTVADGAAGTTQVTVRVIPVEQAEGPANLEIITLF